MVVVGLMDGVRSFYCSLVVVGKMKQHLSCGDAVDVDGCLLYTSPSPRDKRQSRMPSSA